MIETRPSKTAFNRRRFLGLVWAASLVGLVGQAGWALLQFFQPRVKAGAFGGLVHAGQVAEFQPGMVKHILAGSFFISHVEGAGLLALWHRCTHLGCTVPWREEEGQFHCPCHSTLFNRAGEVTGGPAPRPLDLFPIEIVNGEVIVDTGRAIERGAFDPSQAASV